MASRRCWSVLAAMTLGAATVVVTPVRPAVAQAPEVPSVSQVTQLLGSLVGNALGGLIGPNVDAFTSGDAPIPDDGDYLRVSATYNCAGLFLPIQGLDGPITLEFFATQFDASSSDVTQGYRKVSTPVCDGTDVTMPVSIPISISGNGHFGTGTAYVEADLTACDLTGCNRSSSSRTVNIS